MVERRTKALAGLAWALLFIGLLVLAYPKVTGRQLVPVYTYDNLDTYHPAAIPFVYIGSYFSRAWGAFLFAFMLGGMLEAFISRERMQKYLSSKSVKSYLLAALFAPVMALCSCAMIPIFGGIMIAGAGIGPALTFLLMAPAANFLAILFTSELISPAIAGARFGFAFAGSILIGFLVSKTRWAQAVEQKFAGISATRRVEAAERSFWEKSVDSMREAYTLAKIVLPYLLLGVAVVSYIDAYMPRDVVANYMTGARGIFIASALGVPLYTPTLVEVFFVKALMEAGMSASAALAFLLGAPMSSIPSMLGVSRIIGWKTVVTYALLAVLWGIVAGFSYMALTG